MEMGVTNLPLEINQIYLLTKPMQVSTHFVRNSSLHNYSDFYSFVVLCILLYYQIFKS